MLNIIISKSIEKAEEYCKKNNFTPGDTSIVMFFSEASQFIHSRYGKIIVHDIDSKLRYLIKDIERISDGTKTVPI